MTHQAMVAIISTHGARCCFSDERTDTTYENNDHLLGRGLVDQKVNQKMSGIVQEEEEDPKSI